LLGSEGKFKGALRELQEKIILASPATPVFISLASRARFSLKAKRKVAASIKSDELEVPFAFATELIHSLDHAIR
jgi:hypothetical protein